MWMFWIITGLVAAGAAALVMTMAGASARRARAETADPALPVYRRQLAELEEAAQAGLLEPQELRAARAEAGRRLLKAADAEPARRERDGGRASRLLALGAAAGAAALALGGYLWIGSPGLPDQPYARRLAAWRAADPATLDPPRVAAVLREIVRTRPQDPQAYDYLGRAEMASGDAFAASRAFAHAAALAPNHAELYADEAEALVRDADGKATPQALAAFAQALRLDPTIPGARYYLARSRIAAGDVQGGLGAWRSLAADLPADDPRRSSLLAEIDRVQASGAAGLAGPPAAAPAAAALTPNAPAVALNGPQGAFIQAMVQRQAAGLKAHPDDPAGWARLVRSYRVLGDQACEAQALSEARQIFAHRPDALAPIEAQARGEAGPVARP